MVAGYEGLPLGGASGSAFSMSSGAVSQKSSCVATSSGSSKRTTSACSCGAFIRTVGNAAAETLWHLPAQERLDRGLGVSKRGERLSGAGKKRKKCKVREEFTYVVQGRATAGRSPWRPRMPHIELSHAHPHCRGRALLVEAARSERGGRRAAPPTTGNPPEAGRSACVWSTSGGRSAG